MLFVIFIRYLHLLLALPFMAGVLSSTPGNNPGETPEKVNLALRRTADGLLRAAGDSTSRIPAIERVGEGVWRVRLEQTFQYEQLPPLLQASLDLYGIRQSYQVAVRRCADDIIDLGYHQLDFLQNDTVPCDGRAMPEGCHYIEVAFLNNGGSTSYRAGKRSLLLLLMLMMGAGIWWFYRKRATSEAVLSPGEEADWLEFGQSRLDVAGQVLVCEGVRQHLTFRETKLLRLFVTHADHLLERDLILRKVWAEEGVLVGRSVDVFVSRLRKKLAADPSVGIVTVHGVGYRLKTGKEE